MSIDQVVQLAAASGGILYVMAALLLIALTVIIEKSFSLRMTIRRGDAIARSVADLRHLDDRKLKELAAETEKLPHGAVLAVPLQYPTIRDPIRLAELLEEAVMWQVPRIDARLWILDTIVTLAPLLGLLGTIIGMFNTFQILGSGNPGGAPTQITGGVAEALVATACGLFIAIIGLVFFNSLNNCVRLIIHQMETIKVMLVNRLDAPRTAAREPESDAAWRAVRQGAEA